MAEEIVRRVTITANGQSTIDAAATSLNKLAVATGVVAEVTDSSARRALSAEAAWKRLHLSLDPNARAQEAIAKATKTANAALAQGIITQAEYSKSIDKINSKYTTQTGVAAAVGKATGALQMQMASLAGGLGLTGSILTAYGPAGFAAAIGIGAITSGLSTLSDMSHTLAGKAKEISEFSEATGISTAAFQALRSEAGKFGIDSEKLATGLSKFTVGFSELRLGSGSLLEDINKINPALAQQMKMTTDAGAAFTLFGKAVAQTSDIFQRNALLKAGLGRGSSQYGALFASGIDVNSLAKSFTEAGKGIDEQLISKLKQLEIDINKTKGAASTVFATIFGTSTLEGELQFQRGLLEIAKTLRTMTFSDDFRKFIDFISNPATIGAVAGAVAGAATGAVFGGIGAAPGAIIGAGIGFATGATVQGVKNIGRDAAPETFTGSGRVFDDVFKPFDKQKAEDAKKTVEALANESRDLVAVLGSAATPSEKLSAAIAQLGITATKTGVSADALARGINALKLDSAIAQLNARNSALGASVPISELVYAKTLQLQKLQNEGAGLTKDQIKFQKDKVANDALGITQLNGQIDAEKVRAATLFMTTEAATAYAIVQTRINEGIRNGNPLTDAEIRKLEDKAQAYAKISAETNKTANTIGRLRDGAESFTDDLVSGLMSGKSAMSSLGDAAMNLSKQLTSGAIKSLLSGDLISAGVQAVGALITNIFGKAQKKREEEQKAQDAAVQRMLGYQQRAKLAGVDTQTEVGALLAFDVQANAQRQEEAKNGNRALASLELALAAERGAIISDFAKKAIEDEKAKQDAINARVLTASDRLFAALNDSTTLEGQLAAADRQFAKERYDEMKSGGEALNELVQAQESERVSIIKKANQELLDYVKSVSKTIRDYLQGLKTGASSTLSPQAQLAAAQSYFNSQIQKANSGDRDALGSITATAQTLLDQAKSFYASSGGYTSIYDQVTAALNGVANISTSTVSDSDKIVAAIDAGKVATTSTIASTSLQEQSLLGAMNLVLNATNTSADRFVNAVNGLGSLTAQIGSNHTEWLSNIYAATAKTAANGGGSFWSWLGFQDGGRIPGYDSGGIVGNGVYNVDSVMAKHSDGSSIALAGGEFVTRATSVNSQTSGMLNYINKTGRTPGNDNSEMVRVIAAGFNGQTQVLAERLEAIDMRIKRLDDTTRNTVTPRRVLTAKG